MRLLPGLLPLLTLLLVPGLASASSWEPAGPHGAAVLDLAADPSTPGRVYAGTMTGGVYRSNDGGLNWQPVRAGFPREPFGQYPPVVSVCVAPDGTLYAASGLGAFRSEDAGASWDEVAIPDAFLGRLSQFLISPDDPTVLIGNLSRGSGVVVGTGGGASWTERNDGLGADKSQIKLLRAARGFDHVYAVAGNSLRLYRAPADVASWTPLSDVPGTRILDLLVLPGPTDDLLLSTDSGCFRSADGGTTWQTLDLPEEFVDVYRFVDRTILRDKRNEGREEFAPVLGLGRGGVYGFLNDPDRMQLVADLPYTRVSSSLLLDDGTILLGSDMGVFRGNGDSSDPVFLLRNDGIEFTDVTVVAPARGSDVIYAGTGISYDGGVFRSHDGGATWSHRSAGITNPDIRSIAVYEGNSDIVYVGTADALDDTGENGRVFKTVDGGLTWTDVTPVNDRYSGGQIIIALAVHPNNPDVVYASVQSYFGGIFKSVNGGATWTRASTGLQSMPSMPGLSDADNAFIDYFAMLSLAIDPGDPETVHIGAGGCWGGAYVTHDGGAHWARRDQNGMEVDAEALAPEMFGVHLELFDIAVSPLDSRHLLATGGRGAREGNDQYGIAYESTDGGESWHLIREKSRGDYFSAPLTGLVMHGARAGEWYLATRDGVLRTTAGGTPPWTRFNDGLSTVARSTRSIAADPDDPDRLYLATSFAGVWRRQLEPTPVRLTRFEAAMASGSDAVRLVWSVADATNHAGFHVEREIDGRRTRLTSTLLPPAPQHVFEDAAPVRGAVNRYWLVEFDRIGGTTTYGPAEILVPAFRGLALGPAYPNPVQAGTRLLLTTAPRDRVGVRVLDVQGREIRRLVDGASSPGGVMEVSWDRTDARGHRVGSGVYFIYAVAGERSAVRKVLVAP